MLTPDEITKKTFTVRHVRGYDPQEVDDFLDRIVADYASVLQQLNAASARYSNASTQQLPVVPAASPVVIQKVADPIGDVARLLSVAQQSADQQAAEAQAAANQVIAEAQVAGSKVLQDAQAQAAQIIAEGNTKRNEIVGALEVKRTELQSKVDALGATHADAVAKLRAALEKLGDPAA